MPTMREIICTLIAAAAVAVLAIVAAAQLGPQAAGVAYLRPAVAAGHHIACDWHIVHRLDAYTTWQYVTPDEARYERVGPCAKVIVGTGQSVIIGQDGHVADVS